MKVIGPKANQKRLKARAKIEQDLDKIGINKHDYNDWFI